MAARLRAQGTSTLWAKRTLLARFPHLEHTEALVALEYIPEPGLWVYKKEDGSVFGEGTAI